MNTQLRYLVGWLTAARMTYLALLIALVALPAGCGVDDSRSAIGTDGLTISGAWTRAITVDEHAGHSSGTATPGTQVTVTTAVYFTIENGGDADDQLLSVTTRIADAAEMHESSNNNGVMQMRQAQVVELPAGETVVFEPGGLHVMLIGVHESLEPGDTVDLALTFAHAGAITVTVEVRDL